MPHDPGRSTAGPARNDEPQEPREAVTLEVREEARSVASRAQQEAAEEVRATAKDAAQRITDETRQAAERVRDDAQELSDGQGSDMPQGLGPAARSSVRPVISTSMTAPSQGSDRGPAGKAAR